MWSSRRFQTERELVDFLNGAVLGTVNLHPSGANVDGLTLIVNAGGVDRTVTFAPALGRNWTADEILAQILATAGMAGVASLHVPERYDTSHPPGRGTKHRYLRLFSDPAIIVRNTGTGNAALGFNVAPAADQTQALIALANVVRIESSHDPTERWVVILDT